VSIVLTNAVGQDVATLKMNLKASANTFQVPIDKVHGGIYQLTMRTADQSAITKRVTILK
jgi:hypothetical protein